jgi:ribosomal protein S18 acetylase RimI-like enzyme
MIRTASIDDLDRLVGLLQVLFSIEEDFVFSAHKQRQGLELLLDSEQAHIVVAVEADQIIGMATGQLLVSTAEGGLAMIIEDVVIAPGFRRRGHGRQLLLALARWGASRGAGRMQLLADRTNQPALDFYRYSGWTITQLICLRKYYSN